MRGLGELGNKYRWDEPKSIQSALDEKPQPMRYRVEPSLGPKLTVKFGVIIIKPNLAVTLVSKSGSVWDRLGKADKVRFRWSADWTRFE